jgi:hypothetical protein
MEPCAIQVESTNAQELLDNSAANRKRYGNCGKIILNKGELLRLLERGTKRSDIARLYGVDRSAITKAMRRMAA